MVKNKILNLLKHNYKMLLFCLGISLIVLLFTSANSPLYPMNFLPDINIYFTIGKGWINGLIPYMDVFDQKGPIVYLIYALGALISSKTFIGIYILEVISFTIFLFYIHKIVNLFLENKYNLLILPLFAVFICTVISFASGGTAEEFALPYLTISLYYLFYYFKGNELTKKQYFINGLLAGIIFMLKLNLIAFWFGFMLFIFIDLLMKKKVKEAFINSFIFVLAMLIPLVIFSIYFLIVGALKDFYYGYFYVNTFAYGSNLTVIEKINNALPVFIRELLDAGIIFVFLFVLVLSFVRTLTIKRKYKVMFYIIILFVIILTYLSGSYEYYLLFILPFCIFAFMDLIRFFRKYINKLFFRKFSIILLIILYLGLTFYAYKGANYRYFMEIDLKENARTEIANEINKSKDKSLLTLTFLDLGFYYLTDTLPTEKYYFRLNVFEERFPQLFEEQRRYLKEKRVNFVLLVNADSESEETMRILKKGYKKVMERTDILFFPNNTQYEYNFVLYKRKNS